jgi:hypothetical protein
MKTFTTAGIFRRHKFVHICAGQFKIGGGNGSLHTGAT